jgi:hypothetical protein
LGFAIPPEARPHLIAMVEAERARIEALHDVLSAREEGGDDAPWPEEFDPNDAPIYEMIRRDLSEAGPTGAVIVDIWPSKFCGLLTMIIPAYVSAHFATLTASEIGALKFVFDQGTANFA